MRLLIAFLGSVLLLVTLNGCESFISKIFPSNGYGSSSEYNNYSYRDIDPDQDGDIKGAGYFSSTRPATGKRVFIFDPAYSAWAAYNEDGILENTGRASGGKHFCPDINEPCRTVVGTFNVYSKGDEECISSKYPIETQGGAPMPYCMHFFRGYAVHGSSSVPDYNASHGCIRVTPAAAKWLNEYFINIGTTVIVLPYTKV